MADEATTTEKEPVQAYNIGSRTMEPVATSQTTEQQQQNADPPKTDATKPPVEGVKPEGAAADPAKAAADAAKPPVTPPTVDFNSLLKEKFSIDSEEKLGEILASNKTFQEQLRQAQEAPKEPKFDNEQDKAAYEFLKQYPVSRIGEGLKTYSSIINMDVQKADGRDVMKEAFILSKPDLTREKAEKLFEADYKRRYTLDKESFKTDDEYKEAQELAGIEKDEREAIARRTLAEKQAQIKKEAATPPKTAENKPETPKVPEAAQGYIAKANALKLDKLSFTDAADEKIKYHIPVPADRLKAAQEFAQVYLKDPRLYGEDGKIANFDEQDLIHTALMMLDPKWYRDQHVQQVTSLARTIQAEQIAGTKPDKESKGAGQASGTGDITDQFKDLAKKAVAERAQGRR